jgi:small conductance mechanosensitive channel
VTALPPAALALLSRLTAVLATIAVLLIAYVTLTRLIERRLAREGEAGVSPRLLRLRTVSSLLSNVFRWVVGFVVLVVVLRELGVDVQALVVSAGVLGLALGFGAQSLVKDVITGVFLLFEGLIAVGDLVEVDSHQGAVEAIGLRVTKLRAFDGSLHVVPNGQLAAFTNRSRGWARAVVEIALPRQVPVESALDVLKRAGEEWARESGVALEAPQTHGIIRFNGAEAILRLTAKVESERRLDAEYELRRRVRQAFEREQWPAGGPAQQGAKSDEGT